MPLRNGHKKPESVIKIQSRVIGAIVQARMSSIRFPGKVLYQVSGRPLLQYLLDNLIQCTNLDLIVVATSADESDVPIVNFCVENGFHYYCGDLQNVVNRFKGVLERYPMDGFVRVNGDSPLIHHHLIDCCVKKFTEGGFDLVTNVMPRSFPRGQSVEILKTETFTDACRLMQEEEDLEHVTRFFYRNYKKYSIYNVAASNDCSDIYLCVDTEDHMEVFRKIIAMMTKPHWQYDLDEILTFYRQVTA